jgi:hypothetical protein
MKERRVEFEKIANEIIIQMKGKEKSAIKNKMKEAKIPDAIIKELLPAEEKAAEGEEAKKE